MMRHGLVGLELVRVAYLTEGPPHLLDDCHVLERRHQSVGRGAYRVHCCMTRGLGREPRLFGGGARRLSGFA